MELILQNINSKMICQNFISLLRQQCRFTFVSTNWNVNLIELQMKLFQKIKHQITCLASEISHCKLKSLPYIDQIIIELSGNINI